MQNKIFRKRMKDLILWKESKHRKSLLLRGARQVGKTHLVRDFGQQHFEHFFELNFEEDPKNKTFFESPGAVKKILRELSAFFGKKILPGKSLLFLDEIQEAPQAIKALRFFYEKIPELHVIGAGSLLEFALEEIPLGVGRISFLHLYPLSFREFLSACGEETLKELLETQNLDQALPEALHDKATRLLRDYSCLGGMPQVVAHFLEHQDFIAAQNLQSDLIETYEEDFAKYAKRGRFVHLQMLFEAAPGQLGKKFKYSNVDTHTRSEILKEALTLLEKARVLYRVFHTKADGLPLKARIDPKKFKVLFLDIGLAGRLLGIDLKTWMQCEDLFSINQGALTEQLVGQELLAEAPAQERPDIFYWHREARSSNAEVDYVLARANNIYPMEVKQSTRGGLKSLTWFLKTRPQARPIKVSAASFKRQNNLLNLPLYAVSRVYGKGL